MVGLGCELEAPAPQFSEALNDLRSILLSKCPGLGRELSQTLLEFGPGRSTIPVFYSRFRQKLAFDSLQLLFHHRVIDEVHLLKLVDEADEAVQGLLMDPSFAIVDTGEHVFAELRCLLP